MKTTKNIIAILLCLALVSPQYAYSVALITETDRANGEETSNSTDEPLTFLIPTLGIGFKTHNIPGIKKKAARYFEEWGIKDNLSEIGDGIVSIVDGIGITSVTNTIIESETASDIGYIANDIGVGPVVKTIIRQAYDEPAIFVVSSFGLILIGRHIVKKSEASIAAAATAASSQLTAGQFIKVNNPQTIDMAKVTKKRRPSLTGRLLRKAGRLAQWLVIGLLIWTPDYSDDGVPELQYGYYPVPDQEKLSKGKLEFKDMKERISNLQGKSPSKSLSFISEECNDKKAASILDALETEPSRHSSAANKNQKQAGKMIQNYINIGCRSYFYAVGNARDIHILQNLNLITDEDANYSKTELENVLEDLEAEMQKKKELVERIRENINMETDKKKKTELKSTLATLKMEIKSKKIIFIYIRPNLTASSR